MGSLRVDTPQAAPQTIGRLVAIRSKLAEQKRASAEALHEACAPVVAAILDGYGNDAAAAETLRKTDQNVSDQRNGRRGTAFWEMVALMADSPSAFLAFASLFCALHGYEPPQPKRKVTHAELALIALELMATGPLMTLLVSEAERRKGASEAEVVSVLTE